MKSLRTRFSDNYTAVVVPADNKKGQKTTYVYYAPWYIWDLSAPDFRRKKAVITAMELVSLLIFCVTASLKTPLNSWKGSLAFSAFGMCFQVMELTALVDFLSSESRTTKMKFENISRGFSFFAFMRAALFALSAVLCAVYTAVYGISALSCAVCLGHTACALLAWFTRRVYKAIPFHTEENDALKRLGVIKKAKPRRQIERLKT